MSKPMSVVDADVSWRVEAGIFEWENTEVELERENRKEGRDEISGWVV
jgi:hypothetical protein